MAQTLFISEYPYLPFSGGHTAAIAEMPPLTSQTVTVSGSAAQSSAFQPSTRVLRLHLDAGTTTGACVRVGSNPTAVNTDTRLAVNQTEYFYVSNVGASTQKLSVISSAI